MSDSNSLPNINLRNGVAFFPTLESLAGNPYWPILVDELEKKGVFFDHQTPYTLNFRWLIRNRKSIKVIHFHFVQHYYKSSTTLKKIVKLLIFIHLLLFARILGYRTIYTLHNLVPTYNLKPAWIDYLGQWVATNLSERVIVYCHEAKRLLREKYGRKNNVYFVDHPNLLNYYPNNITKEHARHKLNISQSVLVFAFIGGVRPNKGVEILIEAFKQLENNNYRLIIAGNSFPPESYTQSLLKMAEDDERISFDLKFIPDDEIQVYLKASDVVVLPFSKILTSGTANLSMSFGKPVIAPRVGCLTELIEPGMGWLFEQDDPGSLARKMEIAAQSEFEKVGMCAYAKLSTFSPERFAEQTLKAYGTPETKYKK